MVRIYDNVAPNLINSEKVVEIVNREQTEWVL